MHAVPGIGRGDPVGVISGCPGVPQDGLPRVTVVRLVQSDVLHDVRGQRPAMCCHAAPPACRSQVAGYHAVQSTRPTHNSRRASAQPRPLSQSRPANLKGDAIPGPDTGGSGLWDLTGSRRSFSSCFLVLRCRASRNMGRAWAGGVAEEKGEVTHPRKQAARWTLPASHDVIHTWQ